MRVIFWIVGASWCTNAFGIVLYSQTPDFESNFDFSSNTWNVTADNFVPSANWLLHGITFQGGWSANRGAVGLNDTSRRFRIDLYTDVNLQPANVPFRQISVVAAMSNPTLYRAGEYIVYDIVATFPSSVSPILLTSGKMYWVSVVDFAIASPPPYFEFYWSGSNRGGDGLIAQHLTSLPWNLFRGYNEVGFALIGEVVPEPTTLSMVVLVFVVCGFIHRRR